MIILNPFRNVESLSPPLLLLALLFLATIAEAQKSVSFVTNGGLEHGMKGWVGGAQVDTQVAHSGRQSLRIHNGAVTQDLTTLKPGETYTCSVYFKVDSVQKTGASGYAYLALYQLDEFGDYVEFFDFKQPTGTSDWQRATYTFKVAEDVGTVSLRAGLFQATGTLWIDDSTLVAGQQPVHFDNVVEEASQVESLPGYVHNDHGDVAILKDDLPVSGAPSSPDSMAQVLRAAGFGVTFVNAEQLADAKKFNRSNFDVLALPNAVVFPVAAADNFRQFLRSGGKFLSTGGYAFDDLRAREGQQWVKPSPPQTTELNEVRWHYALPAEELRGKGPLTFSGWMRTLNIHGQGFAFFAVYQYDAAGQLVEFRDVAQVRWSTDWQQYKYSFSVNERAASVELHAGLYLCGGIAWFDEVQLATETGQALLNSSFEQDFNPDLKQPRNWWRPDTKYCTLEAGGGHDSSHSLKCRLKYSLPAPERLNTRYGNPGDGLEVQPTQLGVFDADYFLERVAYAETPGEQAFLPKVRLKGELEGYAASGFEGHNQARWLPLVNAYDRYGRLRGAAGGMLRHYAGPYAGSSWAFFGVTNQDLFADSSMQKVLAATVESLVKDVYLATLQPDQGSYQPGEKVALKAQVFNGGARAATVTARFLISGRTGKPVATLEGKGTVQAGEPLALSATWTPPVKGEDFYRVVVLLKEGKRPIDQLESGFIVLNRKITASGPALRFSRNYLQYGDKPMMLFGTDDYGYVFNLNRETPLQWQQDMQKRQDFGVTLYENLQFGLPATAEEQEKLFRQVDGLAQLAQKHQQVYFPCLLCGYNVAVSDEELERQKAFCRAFAKRYAHVPGLIYYMNGDLQCTITKAVTPQWNQFLKERYETTERLREAWGSRAPKEEIGSLPATDYNEGGWDDVKAYDVNLFRGWLIRRWMTALIGAIREFDKTHPTSAEFYQLPHAGVDIPEGLGDLDLSNIGYFDKPIRDIQRFPSILKYSDQRSRGKSLGPGEYGVKTHPAWGDGKDHGYHITRTRQQSFDLFLAVAHYSLGLGASRIHNWCWKDGNSHIFPWGMVYPCDGVEKDLLRVHRNESLLFRHFSPVYEEPSVYALTPDSHRLGGKKFQVIEGILNSLNLLLGCHIDNLGVLNERGFEIPKSAKAIYWPVPFCPSDDAYGKVLSWVRAGGTLYLSGDLSFDEHRKRTRTKRLEELCGVRFVSENARVGELDYRSGQPCINTEATTAKARSGGKGDVVFENRVGEGRVIFTPSLVEFDTEAGRREQHLALYQSVAASAGVKPIALTPNSPEVHAFRVPLKDGGRVYVLFNTATEGGPRQVNVSDPALPSPVTVTLTPQRPGLVWLDGKGRLRGVESQGDVSLPRAVIRSTTPFMTYTPDGSDLRKPVALVVMPLAPGEMSFQVRQVWRSPAMSVGEVREGRWQRYETVRLKQHPEGLKVTVDRDQSLSLLVLGDQSGLRHGEQEVERSMNSPASLP